MNEKLKTKCTDIIDAETGKVVRTTTETLIPDDDRRLDFDAERTEKLGRFELRRVTKEQE